MARNPLPLRRKRYFELSSRIAQLEPAQVRALFDESEASGGWGRSQTVEIAGTKVFVKRVPVTDLEYENLFSTRNLYDLPTYYNYGVGSAGFGVFRELVTHIKTTNWVLAGAMATFPLTYHYRIVPFIGAHADVDMERHRSYVEYWGSNENIGRYMLDRANARYELILFLEHIPHVLHPWLCDHPDQLPGILNDLRATVAFLRKNGIIHFDAHFGNVMTDGEQAYLTDYGLVLDRSFALTLEEQSFFRQNSYYDYGEVLVSAGYLILRAYEKLPESEKRRTMEMYGITEGMRHDELMPILLQNIEEAGRFMKLEPGFVACLVKYRGVIALMDDFYSKLQRNKKKDTKLRHAELRRLLKETGFISA
jgi:hypothetical protein